CAGAKIGVTATGPVGFDYW
nr:immunoglobulin heavy chain junction region [Macaca mulatta]MOW99718.1 immunoglobulin heavy chain junction region [Macaca mulatta]MOX01470.1 immunoglobulin heavy chain junction region [Macaca mulatta]MOX01629.1 immunoglobulin heavy chain junction region [Macaca mulatta]MOX02910.1 immunoglobulin heavy chain junction region [Macaca mulatta]